MNDCNIFRETKVCECNERSLMQDRCPVKINYDVLKRLIWYKTI